MSETTWAAIATERSRLADDLDQLTDDQWTQASLCPGWKVRDVVAHLVWPHEHGKWEMVRTFVFKAHGDVDRFGLITATADARPAREFPNALRATATSRWSPPGGYGPVAPLTDIVAHGQDIRRAVGASTAFAPEVMREILDFLPTKKATQGFTKKGRFADLSFRATDLDWSHGSGPEVAGPGEALIMALLGRTVAVADLSGEGVDTLRGRL